ncbi:MAG TPA: RsmE family RNA methyltransferase [Candidatus Binataceae bacterium]|nr:RsmE family RNA methyltransferase [Candidatus Binataceae bacterium]
MTRPPRFALDLDPPAAGTVRIAGPELHHMRDVARVAAGETAILIDRNGAEHVATIVRYEHNAAIARIERPAESAPRPPLILAQAVIRGPRMDFIVEKASELGATGLWPFTSARTIAGAAGREKLARWRRLALAACKQSLLAPPLEIALPCGFVELVRKVPPNTLAVLCAEGAEPLSSVLERNAPRGILIACGPEGDLDVDERTAARGAGFVEAGLGPGRLRSETAALAALAIAAEWFLRHRLRAT